MSFCPTRKVDPVSTVVPISSRSKMYLDIVFSHDFLCENVVISSSSSAATIGSPCSRNTYVSFRAVFIIRESFPPVMSRCCVLLSLVSLPYSAANACSDLASSTAMRKNLSRAFSLWVIVTIPPIAFNSGVLAQSFCLDLLK